jgi:flavin-dependent dehydrogenase
MCGDTAGLIAPLCGNGMSMAIHAAKLLCENIIDSGILQKAQITSEDRNTLEKAYKEIWSHHFRRRLFWGKTLQRCFASPLLAGISLRSIHALPFLERWVISNTRGEVVDEW